MREGIPTWPVVLAFAFAIGTAGPADASEAPGVPADAGTCRGHVFEDRDGDGRRDAGEPGIAGAKVSDGASLVLSDASGGYALSARAGMPVFVVKPPGHRSGTGRDGLPAVWAPVPAGAACPDFALRVAMPSPRRRASLRVLLFADPQAATPAAVDWFERDVVDTAMHDGAIEMPHGLGRFHFAGGAGDLGLTLGDVADDDLSLYPGLVAATTRMGVPWLHVPGNHDLDLDAVSDAASLATYRRHFGPDTFAWEEPEASFVMLDDVVHLPGDPPSYIGGLRDDQFAFLAAYLATLPRERMLVLGVHIPLFEAPGRDTFRDADRERLFALLAPFDDVLVVSGHGHVLRHVFHGADSGWKGEVPLHEFNVGAASGAFWSGVAGPDGIPDATMADGTPNGHAVLEIAADGTRRLSWVPAGIQGPRDPSRTRFMHLHAPRVLRRGAYPAFGVYANVYMGLEDTRVEFRVDDGEWRPMLRVERSDPALVAENVRDDLSGVLRGHDRSPEAVPSTHLWRGTLPTDLPDGEHAVEVRAFDRWHGEQHASTTYTLRSAPL